MPTTNADTAAVREFEQAIDEGYRGLEIFSFPPGVALYGLLAVYDSHIVSQIMVRQAQGGAPLTVGQVQIFKSRAEGLVWAIRWLLGSKQVPDACPIPKKALIEQAAELVEYGAKYYTIGMMYSYFSQGVADATVDVEQKKVRFAYTPEYHHPDSSWGFHEDVLNDRPITQGRDIQRRASLQLRAQRAIRQLGYHLESGRVVLDDPAALLNDDIQGWCRDVCESQHVLRPECELGGFTLAHLNAFWQAITAWSIAVTEIYLNLWTRVPQETCMPTQVVAKDDFLAALATLSRLPTETVRNIAARMAYDDRTGKPDIFLQPLLHGPNSVAWSPALVQTSRFQRNILKLMSRTPSEKNAAATIIGDREHQLLDELAQILERKGWSVAVNRKVKGDEEAEVDLLAVNWRFPHEVLIVEGKAFLQADDVNEIKSATVEMRRAQQQLNRIVRLLSALETAEKNRIFSTVEWERVEHWFAIVVTPETEPGISFDHKSIPAASLLTLKRRLRPKDWTSPSRLWRAMAQREWQSFLRDATFSFESLTLAGITFDVPLVGELPK